MYVYEKGIQYVESKSFSEHTDIEQKNARILV
jgi:hypothetical protein